mmetsp:Transcript_29760/g.26317  ORF Transcript_29760/g.26317 Transcript_29760/m.26317 type:complete len:100 (+) Transcript_29760:98-397(+)
MSKWNVDVNHGGNSYSGSGNGYSYSRSETPAIMWVDDSNVDLIEGFAIGVIFTLSILLIGIFIAYVCRKWRHTPNTKQYSKINYVDSEDERIVINNGNK